MSVFSDFQRMWVEKFPESSLSDAWEQDVRQSLSRHHQRIVDLQKELEQETLYVEYLERLLSDVEKSRESGGDPQTLIEASTPTGAAAAALNAMLAHSALTEDVSSTTTTTTTTATMAEPQTPVGGGVSTAGDVVEDVDSEKVRRREREKTGHSICTTEFISNSRIIGVFRVSCLKLGRSDMNDDEGDQTTAKYAKTHDTFKSIEADCHLLNGNKKQKCIRQLLLLFRMECVISSDNVRNCSLFWSTILGKK